MSTLDDRWRSPSYVPVAAVVVVPIEGGGGGDVEIGRIAVVVAVE